MQLRLVRFLAALATLMTSLEIAHADVTVTPPQRSLLALSKSEHTLAIVNPNSLQVIARVPVGPDPHEVVTSDDGKTAYVSNTGSGRFHELNVIDLEAQKELANVDTAPMLGPHGLAFVGGKVWFTSEGSKSIGHYDPKTSKIDWVLGTGQNRTHMLQVTPSGEKIYATNVDSGTISIMEHVLLPPPVTPMGYVLPTAKPSLDWIQTVVPVAKSSEGFDVSPDGRELWTASPADGTISVINLAAKKVITEIDAKIFGANRLRFTPDGKRVLISSLRTGDLFIYDAVSRKQLKRLNLGHGAACILMDTDGSRAFVSCTPDNYIAVVDLKRLEVAGRIDIGGRPDGMAWAVRP